MVVGDREVKTIEHFSAPKKLLQRLGSWVVRQASQTSDPRHHVRLPRLQPRGRPGHAGRLQVHLHARDDHPGGQDDRRGRPRAGADEPEAARVAPVPVDVDVHPPQRRLDLPDLRDVRAAARVHDRRPARRRDRARRVGPLPLLLPPGRRHGRPRAVPDPRRGAVQRRDGAGRARRARRPAVGPADHAPADLRAHPARGARARRAAVALRAGRPRDRAGADDRRPRGRARDDRRATRS